MGVFPSPTPTPTPTPTPSPTPAETAGPSDVDRLYDLVFFQTEVFIIFASIFLLIAVGAFVAQFRPGGR